MSKLPFKKRQHRRFPDSSVCEQASSFSSSPGVFEGLLSPPVSPDTPCSTHNYQDHMVSTEQINSFYTNSPKRQTSKHSLTFSPEVFESPISPPASVATPYPTIYSPFSSAPTGLRSVITENPMSPRQDPLASPEHPTSSHVGLRKSKSPKGSKTGTVSQRFVYKVGDVPIENLGKKSKSSGNSRSRHKSESSVVDNQPPNSESTTQNMNLHQYPILPPSTSPRPRLLYPIPVYPQSRFLPSNQLMQMVSTGYYGPYEVTSGAEGAEPMQNGVNIQTRTKKTQKCRFCINHGQIFAVKGHKDFCTNRKCQCPQCNITRQRQIAVKDQAQLTRQQDAERLQRLAELNLSQNSDQITSNSLQYSGYPGPRTLEYNDTVGPSSPEFNSVDHLNTMQSRRNEYTEEEDFEFVDYPV